MATKKNTSRKTIRRRKHVAKSIQASTNFRRHPGRIPSVSWLNGDWFNRFGLFGLKGLACRMDIKLKHWRGFHGVNALKAAPVLEFDVALLGKSPGRFALSCRSA
jgi:hypothetical protein